MTQKQNSLVFEIVGSHNEKKAIKMKLLMGLKEYEEVCQNSTSLFQTLDKILKANRMGIASIQSFRVESSGFESSLTTRTAEIILKTIQYFK